MNRTTCRNSWRSDAAQHRDVSDNYRSVTHPTLLRHWITRSRACSELHGRVFSGDTLGKPRLGLRTVSVPINSKNPSLHFLWKAGANLSMRQCWRCGANNNVSATHCHILAHTSLSRQDDPFIAPFFCDSCRPSEFTILEWHRAQIRALQPAILVNDRQDFDLKNDWDNLTVDSWHQPSLFCWREKWWLFSN